MNNDIDRAYVFNLGVQLQSAVLPSLKCQYHQNAEDVFDEGLIIFAETRKPAELAVISRKFQIKQLHEDCWKGAVELKIITADIDEEFDSPAEIQRKKGVQRKLKKSIQLVQEDPEIFLNRPAPVNERIEEICRESDNNQLINDLVEFCRQNGLEDEIDIMCLKYRGWTDAAIAEQLGLTAQVVCKRLKRVGVLYRAAMEKREKERVKNAKNPVGAGFQGGSVVQL